MNTLNPNFYRLLTDVYVSLVLLEAEDRNVHEFDECDPFHPASKHSAMLESLVSLGASCVESFMAQFDDVVVTDEDRALWYELEAFEGGVDNV